MKNKCFIAQRQKGFAGVEILLAVVVICLVAGAAALAYGRRAKHASGATVNSQNAASHQTAKPDSNSTSPGGIPGGASGSPTPTSGPATTVIISPAGLRIIVPASLADLTYHLNQSGGSTVISFSTKTLSTAIPACAASSGNGAFDTVIKANGQYSSQFPGQNPNGGLIKQYDGYYLAYRLPTGPCAKGLTPAQQRLLDDQAQAFYGTLDSVTSV